MPATISSLANETLTEIFEFVHASVPVADWHQRSLPSLRLVSRHWDQVIVGSPSLWTSIFITEKSALIPNQFPFQSTVTRISRSGSLPLNVQIDLWNPPNPDIFDENEGHMLGDILYPHAARITSFDLHAESRALQMAILLYLSGPAMPRLRSFKHVGFTDTDIGHVDSFAPFVEEGAYGFACSAILQRDGPAESDKASRMFLNQWGSNMYPALDDIEIVGVLYDFGRFPIMHRLRRLCIRGQPWRHRPTMGRLLNMISSACRTLEILELVDTVGRKDLISIPSRKEPIVFERLRVLSLGYGDPYEARTLLQSIKTPALKKLILEYTSASVGEDSPEDPTHTWLLRDLLRYYPLEQLESLTLNSVVMSANESSTIHIPSVVSSPPPEFYAEHFGLTKFAAIYGVWKLPIFMFLLSRCTSLKHLSLIDPIGDAGAEDPKEMMSVCWQHGPIPTLDTLYFDGATEGLFELLSAVEDDHRLGNRPKPLHLCVGDVTESFLSVKQKEELVYYQRVLATPVPL